MSEGRADLDNQIMGVGTQKDALIRLTGENWVAWGEGMGSTTSMLAQPH